MTQDASEKELILGNKQLISLFFVVVALCGVFFAMGYMVRGNSIKATTERADATATPAAETIRRQQPEPPGETSAAAPASGETLPAADASPTDARVQDTHPAQDAVSASAEVPAQVKDQKPDPLSSKVETKPVAATDAGATYVQVGALARADADATVRTLREQNLPALVAASSKEGLYRILVGPYHLTSDVAEAKSKLRMLGFSNTIVQKQ